MCQGHLQLHRQVRVEVLCLLLSTLLAETAEQDCRCQSVWRATEASG